MIMTSPTPRKRLPGWAAVLRMSRRTAFMGGYRLSVIFPPGRGTKKAPANTQRAWNTTAAVPIQDGEATSETGSSVLCRQPDHEGGTPFRTGIVVHTTFTIHRQCAYQYSTAYRDSQQ